MAKRLNQPLRGRGAVGNPDNRYSGECREAVDDGWGNLDQPLEAIATTLTADSSRTIINYNQSPDVPHDRSINPYRGCEHGCVYCFARPSHAWLGLSPGLDFETKLFFKPNAVELLRKELAKKGYRCQPIALGINTDCYQPAERKLKITRGILEVLQEHRHPVSIVTKSALIERDSDILSDMADSGLAHVAISIPTLDAELSRKLEPRATSPERRLQTVARLSDAGIPTAVLTAPLIPVLTDCELETIMTRSREAGASWAGYILLRLPHELGEMFEEWLTEHEPLKAQHIMNRIRDCRGGKNYEAKFGERMTGNGVFAQLINQRYHKKLNELGFPGVPELDCSRFRLTRPATAQMALF